MEWVKVALAALQLHLDEAEREAKVAEDDLRKCQAAVNQCTDIVSGLESAKESLNNLLPISVREVRF